ncbi:hypothetical protein B0H13DRAFT_1899182 [Mycena leptocephala]|nr:hypothetical protein B0H13DRAFT_1899182 [Mycena leptocephala]
MSSTFGASALIYPMETLWAIPGSFLVLVPALLESQFATTIRSYTNSRRTITGQMVKERKCARATRAEWAARRSMQNARTLNGHEDVARLLLQKSADITAMNKDNEIALHLVIQNGQMQTSRREMMTLLCMELHLMGTTMWPDFFSSIMQTKLNISMASKIQHSIYWLCLLCNHIFQVSQIF